MIEQQYTDPIWWPIFWLNIGALVLAILIAGLGQVVGNLMRWIDRRDLQRLADEANDHGEPSRAEVELTWTDEALGRVLAALDETDETYLFDAPEFAPPAAQRIRDLIRANHDAEVARFRAELEGWEAS